MLHPIVELERFPSFSAEPHAVATNGKLLYVSSRATRRIDVIARDAFAKLGEIDPPGMPWGMTCGEDELVMTCGESEDDVRRIRRYTPDGGFATDFLPCPDDTGSHLATYQDQVLLGQWYNKRLLHLDDTGRLMSIFTSPHGIAGVAVVNGIACVLGTDDEEHGDYWITRIDLANPSIPPEDVALVPFPARGLAWDGKRWWSNHREANRIVAFVLPN